MKRKPLLIALALVLALVLAACGCSHTWTEASCEAAKTCTQCGKTEGKALGHSWQEASCAAPRTCVGCGLTEGTALEHDWQEASCAAPKTCTVCGLTEGEALAHNWKYGWCDNCGVNICYAQGHNFTSWNASGENMIRSCSVCSDEESVALDYERMLMDNLQGSWHPYAFNSGNMTIPAGQLEGYVIHTQVDAEGNIRLRIGLNDAVEGTVSFENTETSQEGLVFINFLADFDNGETVKMILVDSEKDSLIFGVDGIGVTSIKMEEYEAYFQGNWSSEDGTKKLTLNGDGTFTGNLAGEVSGIWQPRACYNYYGQQTARVILLCEGDSGRHVIDMSMHMGSTLEEAEQRMKSNSRGFLVYYDDNGINTLSFVLW